MTKNLGTVDRVIRLVIAAACAGLIFAGLVQGVLAIVVAVVGVVMLLTMVVSWCPLYGLVGLSTRGKTE